MRTCEPWLGWRLARGRWRILGLVWLATLVLLLVQKSKPYYLAAAYSAPLAAGAVALEGLTSSRFRWLRGVLVALVLVDYEMGKSMAAGVLFK